MRNLRRSLVAAVVNVVMVQKATRDTGVMISTLSKIAATDSTRVPSVVALVTLTMSVGGDDTGRELYRWQKEKILYQANRKVKKRMKV
jgi:hypothetical protein